MAEPARLGVLLLSGSHDRAHYAFVLATGAAALGRTVTLFATNAGCHALMADWRALAGSGRDATIQARGVAGLDVLREAAADLSVRLIACEAGLRAEALDPAALLPSVEVAGIATFLEAVGPGQIVTC
jgi:peroxiredoxin family protein